MQVIGIGDFGEEEESSNLKRCIQVIHRIQQPKNVLIGLGDNFYPNGIDVYMDEESFQKVRSFFLYKKKTHTNKIRNILFLMKQYLRRHTEKFRKLRGRMHMILGNHDYYSNHSDRLELFLHRKENQFKWYMKNKWYNFVRTYNGFKIEFIAIDTNVESLSKDEMQKQKSFLQNILLIKKKCHYRIIFGHHPLFSNGQHGNATGALRKFYEFIIKLGRIDIIMSGHDHDKQILQRKIFKQTIIQIVSGSSCRSRPINILAQKRKGDIFTATYGFIELLLRKSSFVINIWNNNNKIEFSKNFLKIN